MNQKNWKTYAFWILLSEATGILAGWLTREGIEVYSQTVDKPFLTPPSIVFPIVWTITKGDPASRTDTLVTYLYKLAFYNGKQGEAAAVSVIGFMILLVCASVYMVSTLKKGDD